jgi:hypothetical protein
MHMHAWPGLQASNITRLGEVPMHELIYPRICIYIYIYDGLLVHHLDQATPTRAHAIDSCACPRGSELTRPALTPHHVV